MRRKFVLALILGLVMAAISVTGYAQPPQQSTTGICPCVASMSPISVSGKIESLTFPMAVLKTPKGETYTLRLGPWWFWQDKGYKLNVGDNVEVEGFQSSGLIVPSVIRAPSGDIKLRDSNGYPLWGGGGPRGGRGRW
ncbi:MAG: hypothetical protein WHS38_03365 [Thermodesulforhabdaceae bacterium]